MLNDINNRIKNKTHLSRVEGGRRRIGHLQSLLVQGKISGYDPEFRLGFVVLAIIIKIVFAFTVSIIPIILDLPTLALAIIVAILVALVLAAVVLVVVVLVAVVLGAIVLVTVVLVAIVLFTVVLVAIFLVAPILTVMRCLIRIQNKVLPFSNSRTRVIASLLVKVS